MRSANPLADGFSRDTVYRFLNSMAVNWQAFLLTIASMVIADFDKLTADSRQTAFVIDDTMFQIPYAKKAELVSLVHDHAEKGKNKFKWGFRMLTLCWTDGISLIPLAFRHMASADEKKRRTGITSTIDRRSRAYRIRKEAMMKATDVLLLQLRVTLKAGVRAKHVLFDAWFSFPVTIRKICALGLQVTSRVRNTSKVYYLANGAKKTAKQIYQENRKRRGRSRYLLSVPIALPASDDSCGVALPARLVFVRNRQKRKDWIALITTDLELNEDDIIALYGKRWKIEVFFKVCKSYLKLSGEFQQLSYDALVAHTSIVMVRYIIFRACS